VISIGDHKTRKKDVLEKMFRQELTKTAMKKVERKRGKDVSRSATDEGLWDVVDEAAEGVEREVKEEEREMEEKEREEEGVLGGEGTDTEFETPMERNEAVEYMPIQSVPRIVTTTSTEHGPSSVSTITTTHVS
jgi:hypothetical protein